MKIVAEFNSIQEIKDFAELIGQKELVLETNQIAQEVDPEKEESINSVDFTNTNCSVCGEPQFNTPSGVTCKNGHGGAESIQEPTQEKEELKVEELKVEEPTQEKEEVKKLTKEDIRAIFSKLIQAGKQKEAKELTNRYGAKKIPEIKEEDYEAIYKEAEELL